MPLGGTTFGTSKIRWLHLFDGRRARSYSQRATARCVFDWSSNCFSDRKKKTCLIELDMPVEQIGQSHEGASLTNRSLIVFLPTGLNLPYELPNLALFTRKFSDKIESASHLMPAPPEHQSVFKLKMKPQIGFQAGPCMHCTLVKFAIQRIGGQGCRGRAQGHQCLVEPSMLECKAVNDPIDHL